MKTISYHEFIVKLTEKNNGGDFPSYGSFELTPLCNLDCKMCYVHQQDSSVKTRMLSGDQWISIMDAAISKGMLSALLTGGEAMTHPDFRTIYRHLAERGVELRLKSNGILLNEENLAFLKKYPPRIIDISLYGCNSESYIAVTGYDAFATVRDNIQAAIDSGFCVRLMITPSKYMQPWTEEVIKTARNLGAADVVVNSLLFDAREGTGRTIDDFGLTVNENTTTTINSKKFIQSKVLPPDEYERIYGGVEKRPDVSDYGLYCLGGKFYFAVSWDGTMEPCLNFPAEILSAFPLRDGFDTAWRTINEGVRNYQVPKKCHHCSINTKCHYCPTQHNRCSIDHRCDESVCAYWHNIYENQ